jgi:hypothetical protein
MKLTAANTILKSWPTRTQKFTGTVRPGYWVKVRPSRSGPQLRQAGCLALKTQPDGAYAYVGDAGAWVDLIAIEVCGTVQNLHDKRSRYMATTSARLLQFKDLWLASKLPKTKGRGWESFGTLLHNPGAIAIPVRFLRVLYVIPDSILEIWSQNHIPGGHEYFIKDSSFPNFWPSPLGQQFLGQLVMENHFY